MIENEIERDQNRNPHLCELEKILSNPLHKRLISAYQGEDPVHSMEQELSRILLEVIERED